MPALLIMHLARSLSHPTRALAVNRARRPHVHLIVRPRRQRGISAWAGDVRAWPCQPQGCGARTAVVPFTDPCGAAAPHRAGAAIPPGRKGCREAGRGGDARPSGRRWAAPKLHAHPPAGGTQRSPGVYPPFMSEGWPYAVPAAYRSPTHAGSHPGDSCAAGTVHEPGCVYGWRISRFTGVIAVNWPLLPPVAAAAREPHPQPSDLRATLLACALPPLPRQGHPAEYARVKAGCRPRGVQVEDSLPAPRAGFPQAGLVSAGLL
jgi:hypothetical protein